MLTPKEHKKIQKAVEAIMVAIDKELRPILKKSVPIGMGVMAQASWQLLLTYMLSMAANGCPVNMLLAGIDSFATDIKNVLKDAEVKTDVLH